MRGRRNAVAVLACVAACLLAACGGASSSSGSAAANLNDATKKLVDAARAEGALDMNGVFNGAATEAQALIEDFNKRYGLNTSVKYTPFASHPDEAAKLIAERKAGQAPHTDMFLGPTDFIRQLNQADTLVPLQMPDPTALDSKWLNQSGGVAIPFYTIFPGIAYNTNLVKGAEVPSTYGDLLNRNVPLAGTPYAAIYLTLAAPAVWGPDKAIAYATAYSKKMAGLGGCGNEAQVASGQFAILAPDCAENFVNILKNKGAPIAYVIPKDAPIIYWFWGSVLKGAAHPNTAQLFINYLATPGAQKVIYKYDLTDLDILPGSRTGQERKSYEAKGYKFYVNDFDFLAANNPQALPAYAKIIQIMTTKQG